MATLIWQKSSFSGEAANCVNVAAAPGGGIRVRESDEPGVMLEVGHAAFHRFIGVVKRGNHPVSRVDRG